MTSPKGEAIFPHLNKPNVKYNPDGEYGVNLRVHVEDEGVKEFLEMVDEALAESIEKARRDNPKQAKRISNIHPPYVDSTDADGNEIEGYVDIKFKLKTFGNSKIKPVFFDGVGARVENPPIITFGSMLKVSANINQWYAAGTGAGITLRIRAVQIISVGERNFDDYGFDVEEGAYMASETEMNSRADIDVYHADAGDDGAAEEDEDF